MTCTMVIQLQHVLNSKTSRGSVAILRIKLRPLSSIGYLAYYTSH